MLTVGENVREEDGIVLRHELGQRGNVHADQVDAAKLCLLDGGLFLTENRIEIGLFPE